jgi:hypothetical protein
MGKWPVVEAKASLEIGRKRASRGVCCVSVDFTNGLSPVLRKCASKGVESRELRAADGEISGKRSLLSGLDIARHGGQAPPHFLYV